MRARPRCSLRDLAGGVRQVLPLSPAVEDLPGGVHELAPPYRPRRPVEQGQSGAHRQAARLHVRAELSQDEDT